LLNALLTTIENNRISQKGISAILESKPNLNTDLRFLMNNANIKPEKIYQQIIAIMSDISCNFDTSENTRQRTFVNFDDEALSTYLNMLVYFTIHCIIGRALQMRIDDDSNYIEQCENEGKKILLRTLGGIADFMKLHSDPEKFPSQEENAIAKNFYNRIITILTTLNNGKKDFFQQRQEQLAAQKQTRYERAFYNSLTSLKSEQMPQKEEKQGVCKSIVKILYLWQNDASAPKLSQDLIDHLNTTTKYFINYSSKHYKEPLPEIFLNSVKLFLNKLLNELKATSGNQSSTVTKQTRKEYLEKYKKEFKDLFDKTPSISSTSTSIWAKDSTSSTATAQNDTSVKSSTTQKDVSAKKSATGKSASTKSSTTIFVSYR
jgi:hypothetical protein